MPLLKAKREGRQAVILFQGFLQREKKLRKLADCRRFLVELCVLGVLL
jgi:hypothetical protein